jgi:small subunit ribosomal protein S21
VLLSIQFISQGGENRMTTVKVGENETLDSAIKRWKRKCQKDGIIGDIRKKEAYVKPSIAKKLKSEAARKRARKG